MNTTYLNGKMPKTSTSSANHDEVACFDACIGDGLHFSISTSVRPISSLLSHPNQPIASSRGTLGPPLDLHPFPSHTLYAVNPAHSTGPTVLTSTPSGKTVK